MRSPSSAAIGASSTGGLGARCPGRRRGSELTQRTSRKQPEHLAEGEHDADEQHADDQGVEARIGQEGGPDLAIEDEGQKARRTRKTHHPHEDKSAAGASLCGVVRSRPMRLRSSSNRCALGRSRATRIGRFAAGVERQNRAARQRFSVQRFACLRSARARDACASLPADDRAGGQHGPRRRRRR